MVGRSDIFLDQALFGYSEGHRQLASSIRLPSLDIYQLAAASDFAGGLEDDQFDGYLTGLALAESRTYALIKTWPAPEMPRPGCVWSHVLFLSRKQLSSIVSLVELESLFRRPDGLADLISYSEKIQLVSTAKSNNNPEIMVELIDSYYRDLPIGQIQGTIPEINSAMLHVWSQQ